MSCSRRLLFSLLGIHEMVIPSNVMHPPPSYLYTHPVGALDIIIISSFQLIKACHGILGIREPFPPLPPSLNSRFSPIQPWHTSISNVPTWVNISENLPAFGHDLLHQISDIRPYCTGIRIIVISFECQLYQIRFSKGQRRKDSKQSFDHTLPLHGVQLLLAKYHSR